MEDAFVRDIGYWLLSVGIAGALLKTHMLAADFHILPQVYVRKSLHITTGLVYVATWTFFSDSPYVKWLVVSTPVIHTLRILAAYLGVIHSQELLKTMTTTGRREDLIRGPIWYGLVLAAATLWYWRNHPAGVTAIAVMCAGDGFAAVVGWNVGGPRVPYNKRKTLAGSLALVLAGGMAAFGLVQWFSLKGYFTWSAAESAVPLAVAAVAAALVESLPIDAVLNDNLSVPLVAALVATWGYDARL